MKNGPDNKSNQCSNKFKSSLLIIFGIFIGIFMTMMYFSKLSTEEPTATIAEPIKSYVVIADQRAVIPEALRTGTIHYTSAITHATFLLHECKNEITQMNSMQIADPTSFQRAKTEFYGISLPLEEVLLIKLNLVLQIHGYVIERNAQKYLKGIFEQKVKDQQLHLKEIDGNFQEMEFTYNDIKILHDELLTQLQQHGEIKS